MVTTNISRARQAGLVLVALGLLVGLLLGVGTVAARLQEAGGTQRVYLPLVRSAPFFFISGCRGEEDEACGTDNESYMRHVGTRYLVGDFNGDGLDDIFVNSGDIGATERRLHLGRADGTGFNTGCQGSGDGICGTDNEPYMQTADTDFLVGDFNGDGRDDIFLNSADADFTRRALLLGRSDGAGFSTGCVGEVDGICNTDNEGYMRNPDTRLLAGDFNGDGRDDIFIVSGASEFTRRVLLLGRADGSGFDIGCAGQDDGVCGSDAEGYTRNSATRYLVGDFNGDNRDDIFIVSGAPELERRMMLLGRASGSGFDTGCAGQEEGACGTDSEDYIRESSTDYAVGDFNGDGRDDLFVNSSDDEYRRRVLYLGRANGSGFDTACAGESDGVCGTDSEDYMQDEGTRFLVGDYNGDGLDDLFIISGDGGFKRRVALLGRADGAGFKEGCQGEQDDACGTDSESYMQDTNSRFVVGNFNGGSDDIFAVSGESDFRRRILYLGN